MAHPIYKNNLGKRLPSVTTVISDGTSKEALVYWAWNEGIEGRDFRATRDHAANIGTAAHGMIHRFATGSDPYAVAGPHPDTTPEQYDDLVTKARIGFGAFQEWFNQSRLRLIASEVSLVCDEHGFGGTLDAIGEREDGTLVLLDWKSSKDVYPEHVVQVAAYAHLWEHGRPNGSDPAPVRLGDRVESIHILRIGKEYGEFAHRAIPRMACEDAFAWFAHELAQRQLMSVIKKVAK